MADTPYTVAELAQRLDYLLGPVLSSRRSARPLAQQLATLARAEQEFVLHWIEVIDRSNYEMAYQFAAAAPAALARMDAAAAEAWIIAALDVYDREGLHRGSLALRRIDEYLAQDRAGEAATFSEYAPLLELFVCGLAGRPLKLDTAAEPHTDTETLYLPPRIAAFPDKKQNFRVYRIIAALLWAQGRHGTFRADLAAACADFPDPARALALLAHLENLRLEKRISAALPGICRDIAALRGGAIDPRCLPLTAAGADVHTSIALLHELHGAMTPPQLPWRTVLHPAATAVRAARLAREQKELASALSQLARQQPVSGTEPQRFSVHSTGNEDAAEGRRSELRMDGIPVSAPPQVMQLLDSMLQDLGEVPDTVLQAAGENAGQHTKTAASAAGDSATAMPATADTFYYNEWDYRRRHYRKDWCALRESDSEPADAGFVDDTLRRYRHQVAQLKRSFEQLRGEDRLLKRQAGGDDIDLDALVAAHAELRSGRELSDRLHTRRHKAERDLAVLFMVDMSGSTKGWVNDAEREALVMLCEALEVLGDRYAIYGFSGITRQRCEIFRIKRFDEVYGHTVKQRIAGISPQDYTRMGVAIRHLTQKLAAVDARTRLLVTLSDGKPDDYSDSYRGDYGIEDTRRALAEAQHTGIKPYCITIDHEARDYLPHLYGAANWTLVDDVSRLPLKVADIYRRLTA